MDLEKRLDEVDFEDLLNYRMSRLFGKNIKNTALAKVVYNEVLPENHNCPYHQAGNSQNDKKVIMHGGNVVFDGNEYCECETPTPYKQPNQQMENKVILHGGNVVFDGTNNCECESELQPEVMPLNQLANFTMNFANQALEHANQSLKQAPACPMQNETEANNCVNHAMPQMANTCPKMQALQMTPCQPTHDGMMISETMMHEMMNGLIQQLNRIEIMTREMYTTNQELYKSILKYCKAYISNNSSNNC